MLKTASNPVTPAMKPLTPTAALVACSAELSSSMVGQYHAMTASSPVVALVLFFRLRVVVLHHFAALHDKLHSFERGDIFQRIAVDGNDVTPGAGFQGSDFPGPSQKIGSVDGSSLNRLYRCEPQLHHNCELVAVHPVRIDG